MPFYIGLQRCEDCKDKDKPCESCIEEHKTVVQDFARDADMTLYHREKADSEFHG